MRQRISCSTSFSISAASCVPLREAGMKARTPTSTLSPPLTTPVTVPTMVDFSAKAFSSEAQSVSALDLAARQFVVAFGIAAFDGDLELVARLRRLVAGKCRQRQHAFAS